MTVDPADFDAMMRELAEEEDESAIESVDVDVGTTGGSVQVNTTNQSSNQKSKDNRRDTLNSMVSEISTFSAGTGAATFASTVLAASMQSGPVNNTSTRPSMLSARTNHTTTNRASNLSTADVNKSQISVNKSQMSVNKSQMSAASAAVSTASEAFERLANERRMTVDPTDLALLDDTEIDNTSAIDVDGISNDNNVSVGRVSMGTMGETMGEDNGDGSTVFNDTNIYQHLYEPSMSTNHDASSVFDGASMATDAKTFNTRSVKSTTTSHQKSVTVGTTTVNVNAELPDSPSVSANPSPRSVKTTKTSASSIRPSTIPSTRANIPRSPNSDDVMTHDHGTGTGISPASGNSISSRIIEAQYQRALAGGGQGLGSVKSTAKSPLSHKTTTTNHSSSKVVDNNRMSIMSMMTMSTMDLGPVTQHNAQPIPSHATSADGDEQEVGTVVITSAASGGGEGGVEEVVSSNDQTVSSRKSIQSSSTVTTTMTR